MRLAAIYNVWDGTELLKGSVNCVKDHVDEIIIIYQQVSNFGEVFNPWSEIDPGTIPKRTMFMYTPDIKIGGAANETAKRNIGIDIAREKGCTHFINIDCDEYYTHFGEAKEFYINADHDGSVCRLYTYFKLPTLRFEKPDGYFVPFIHKLKPNTRAGNLPRNGYPFYVDPTRRINEAEVVELPIFMHHFSWVRKDINRKSRNSSAKANIERGSWLEDYKTAGPGSFIKDYKQKLVEVKNIFNITI